MLNKIRLYIFLLYALIPALVFSQNIDFSWKNIVPSLGTCSGNAIATDSENNCYIIGQFDKSITLESVVLESTGNKDGVLIKLDENGGLIWMKQFKGGNNINLTSIVINENDELYVVGDYFDEVLFDTTLVTIHPGQINKSSMFVTKFDSSGDMIWAKNTAGISYGQNTLTIDKEDNIILTGKSISIDQFADNELNIDRDSVYIINEMIGSFWHFYFEEFAFISKFSKDGDFKWCKKIGGRPKDINTDNENNIIISGAIGSIPWFTPGANVFYGDDIVFPLGTNSIYLTKHDQNGDLKWLRLAGGSDNNNVGNALVVDMSNNIYVSGRVGGNDIVFNNVRLSDLSYNHAFIAKYTPEGGLDWVNNIGEINTSDPNNSFNGGTSLKINKNNTLVYSGFFKDALSFNSDNFVGVNGSDLMLMLLDLDGEIQKAGQYVRCGWIKANKIALGNNDEIFLTGFVDQGSSAKPSEILIGKVDSQLSTNNSNSIESENDCIADGPEIEPGCNFEFNVYPNPLGVNRHFKIQFNCKSHEDREVMIMDEIGRLISSMKTSNVELELSLSHPGLYLLSVREGSEFISKKIIVFDD